MIDYSLIEIPLHKNQRWSLTLNDAHILESIAKRTSSSGHGNVTLNIQEHRLRHFSMHLIAATENDTPPFANLATE
jgi:hypothetical protein